MRPIRQTVHTRYEPTILDPHAELQAAEQRMAARVMEVLLRHYPGHGWRATVSATQGVITISIPVLMGPTLVYTLHISRLMTDPALVGVMRAGGEILERFGLARGSNNLDAFLEARRDRRIFSRKQAIPT